MSEPNEKHPAAVGDLDPARGPTNVDEVRYVFITDLPDDYVVSQLDGVEELNAPYHLTIHLSTDDELADPRALLGVTVRLDLERGATHLRSLSGVVYRLTTGRGVGARRSVIIEVGPALRALQLTRRSQIFQEQSALEIVERVLTEGLTPYDREVDTSGLDRGRYHNRDYCVQYQETDLDFVHRLLEEEGIGYRFEHQETERLVLFDDNRELPRVSTLSGGPVPFNAHDLAVASDEPITRFHSAKQLTATRATLRDHDWTQGRPTLEATHEEDGAHGHEVYEHGIGHHATISEDAELLGSLIAVAASAVNTAVELTHQLGAVRSAIDLPGLVVGGFTTDNVEHLARQRHELLVRDRAVASGASRLIDLSAGARLELVGHPDASTDGEYYATRVVHTSRVDGAATEAGADAARHYMNTFDCRPFATPWRPERRARKPRIYGLQTATVSAPAGMEVHTDQHGRVKVKFNWDRSPVTLDGSDSCWIRVSQMWAGGGYPGSVFIPRAGMEVVVSFIDGDPDRPLVVGCVHNGRNATPNHLPLQATKSMIRTRTIPHGPGYNELSFEDAMGAERVHIRAQRDLTQHALNDRSAEIGRHDTLIVRGNKSESIEGMSLSVAQRGRSAHVTGADSTTVEGACFHETTGHFVAKRRAGEEVLCLNGDRYVRVENGNSHLLAKGWVEQESDERIVLRVGRAELALTKDQVQITLGGSSFVLHEGGAVINGKAIPAPPGEPEQPAPPAEPRQLPPQPPTASRSDSAGTGPEVR